MVVSMTGPSGVELQPLPTEFTPGMKLYGPFMLLDRGDNRPPLMVEYKVCLELPTASSF